MDSGDRPSLPFAALCCYYIKIGKIFSAFSLERPTP